MRLYYDLLLLFLVAVTACLPTLHFYDYDCYCCSQCG